MKCYIQAAYVWDQQPTTKNCLAYVGPLTTYQKFHYGAHTLPPQNPCTAPRTYPAQKLETYFYAG
jgi:hypothetical protein